MKEQQQDSQATRHGVSWLVALAGIGALLALLLGAAPASASTDNAQLSLTGVVDSNNPTGGSQLGVYPGTTISFTASAAPTAKIKSVASTFVSGSILNSVLGSTSFQVTADFSHLPGGSSNTPLSGTAKKPFYFSHTGSYSFTYVAKSVTPNLLGPPTIKPILLNGNQAKKEGVALNASNQYVGNIVVSSHPSNGISVQLPSVQIHPKVAGHQLPKIRIPGVNLPTVQVSVPNLNKSGSKSKGKAKSGSGSTSNKSNGTSSAIGDGSNLLLPVPARVVPGGFGSTQYGGSDGGYFAAALPGSNSGNGYAPLELNGHTAPSNGGAATSGDNTNGKTVNLAADKTPSAQLPVVLAILAIIALALVSSTYARLFLLRHHTT